VKLIFICERGEWRLEGYCMLHPLAASAVTEILKGEIRGSGQIRENQILSDWSSLQGLYLASVAGRKRHAHFVLMGVLTTMIDPRVPQMDIRRPATKDSLRAMRRAGFQPLFDYMDIWGLEMGDFNGTRGRRPDAPTEEE